MRKVVSLLVFLATLTNGYCQELNGVWISNDDPISHGNSTKNRSKGGIILDFDANTIGDILSDSYESIKFNRKKTKLKADGIKGKLKVQTRDKNLMVLVGAKNKIYVFKKLDLTHQLKMNKKDLSSFLINQQCDLIQGIKGQFTAEQFFMDKKQNKPHRRNQFINFSSKDNGYWYFKQIKKNALFIFTTGKNQPENILQIISLNVNGIKFKPLQEDNQIKNFTSLKTCL